MYPQEPSRLAPEIRSYFLLEAAANSSVQATLVLHNKTDRDLTLHLEALAAVNSPNGNIAYQTATTPTWIDALPSDVHLQPFQTQLLTFTVTVPPNTAPGDYLFGLRAAQDPLVESPTANGAQVALQIRQIIQRIVAVQIHLPGPATYEVKMTDAKLRALPSGWYLTLNGQNNSNMLLQKVTGKIDLFHDGQAIWHHDLEPFSLTPRQPISFSYLFENGAPALGSYLVRIELDRPGGSLVLAELPFAVQGEDLLAPNTPLTGRDGMQTFIPSWVYFLVFVLLLLIILLLILLLRTRRKESDRDAQAKKE